MIAALVVFVSVYLAVRALMVELLQNLQDVYSKWEAKAGPRLGQHNAPESNLKHAGVLPGDGDADCGARSRLRHFPRKPNTVELNPNKFGVGMLRVSKLGHIYRTKLPLVDEEVLVPYKLYPPADALRQSQTLRSRALECCSRCMPMSKSSFGDESVTLLGLENVLNLPHNRGSRFVPFKFIKSTLYLTCKSIPHEYKLISQKIVESESVKKAIENAVREDPATDDTEHQLRAVSILERMKAAISTVLLRFAVWLMHRIMSRMLSGLYVPRGQIELIKQASKHNVPMIYLPLHRSHLDYIVVTFLLYLNEVKVPLVAAGDNLLIPLFGTLLRGLGGFFIKRRLDFKDGRKDYVYRALLKEYMTEILKANHSVEFFIEGGRSRTGKTRLPKAGLLSLIVHCLNEELVRDIYIVPISISYEKILDGNFVSEQLGEPKVMESFTAALRSIWRILHSNYGNVRVDFCQPFSLREFLMSSKVQTVESAVQACPLSSSSDTSTPRFRNSSSCNSLSSNDSMPEDQRHVVQSLANHVVYQSSKSLALMSTNLVALLFLTKHRKGGTLQQLVHSLSWLRSEVFQREHQVMCGHDNAEVVRQACSLLGKDLVRLETIQMEWTSEGATENNNLRIVFYHPTLHLPHVLELQYYANAALPVFLNESIAATAVYAIAGEKLPLFRGSDNEVVFPRNQLAARIELLFNVLQFEFILTLPCRNSHTTIDDAIDKLVNNSLLSICMDPMNYASTHHRKWASSVASTLGWEQDEDGDLKTSFSNEQQLKVVLTEDTLGMLEFLRSVLASYVEAYWVVACSLLKLVNKQMEEKMFFREIQKVAQDRLHQGLLCFEESFAAETLRNAVKLFEQWKIIEHYRQDCVRILYLGERWNSDDAIDSVITLVGDFKT
uniref:Putative mitochondrial glycerol-3-phosphate acyltransferase gpat n=1 Tax=Ornithodoros turicata TaxID=34597 RepID=A0A2R5LNG8_9ACAR